MIAAKQVGAVFVANISRLSRQLIDFEVLRIMAAANHTLIYTDGRFVDPADSNDIVFSQLNAMLAAHENRQRVRVDEPGADHPSQARNGCLEFASRLG